MKSISRTSTLQAPADAVWQAVKKPTTFVHVIGAWLRYPPAERRNEPWRVGDEVTGWLLLLRFIPVTRHTIEVVTIDDETRTLFTREAGGFVRTWNHTITVDPLDANSCRYTDRVDIEAGRLTAIVAGFADRFYGYRQQRWQRFARRLATVRP